MMGLAVMWAALAAGLGAALPYLGGAGIGLAWGWLVADRTFLERRTGGDLLMATLLLAGFVLWFAGAWACACFLGAAGVSLTICALWRRQLSRHAQVSGH
jgi:hypothetical protein